MTVELRESPHSGFDRECAVGDGRSFTVWLRNDKQNASEFDGASYLSCAASTYKSTITIIMNPPASLSY